LPNHCSNSLTVEGPGAEDFFAAVHAQADENFIYQFIPIPKEIEELHRGATTIDGERVEVWRTGADGLPVRVEATEIQVLTDLHGTADWYDWCIHNHGTKWGAYDVAHESGSRILFDSAWSPPEPAIRTISKMFPDATFELAFAEGGSGFFGKVVFQNGVAVDVFSGEDFWKDEEEEVENDDDLESNLTPECAQHLEDYSLHTGG